MLRICLVFLKSEPRYADKRDAYKKHVVGMSCWTECTSIFFFLFDLKGVLKPPISAFNEALTFWQKFDLFLTYERRLQLTLWGNFEVFRLYQELLIKLHNFWTQEVDVLCNESYLSVIGLILKKIVSWPFLLSGFQDFSVPLVTSQIKHVSNSGDWYLLVIRPQLVIFQDTVVPLQRTPLYREHLSYGTIGDR